MTYPATTALYAALLALLYMGLAGWVMARRLSTDVIHGDNDDPVLFKRIRSHANFGEYVPLALILVALLEAGGGSPVLVEGLLIVLLIGRVLHPVGMLAPKNSPRQYACRGGGILATLAVMVVAAVALLLRAS
ncbi:MAPEG family protein [Methylobacterium sp. ID0610]|uniref:MAPEG family protein n=1 Tax=Methylobacterium carpenticola TaxID=3344827 RepID=UPI0036B3C0B9